VPVRCKYLYPFVMGDVSIYKILNSTYICEFYVRIEKRSLGGSVGLTLFDPIWVLTAPREELCHLLATFVGNLAERARARVKRANRNEEQRQLARDALNLRRRVEHDSLAAGLLTEEQEVAVLARRRRVADRTAERRALLGPGHRKAENLRTVARRQAKRAAMSPEELAADRKRVAANTARCAAKKKAKKESVSKQ
jgi:hypothetical protein